MQPTGFSKWRSGCCAALCGRKGEAPRLALLLSLCTSPLTASVAHADIIVPDATVSVEYALDTDVATNISAAPPTSGSIVSSTSNSNFSYSVVGGANPSLGLSGTTFFGSQVNEGIYLYEYFAVVGPVSGVDVPIVASINTCCLYAVTAPNSGVSGSVSLQPLATATAPLHAGSVGLVVDTDNDTNALAPNSNFSASMNEFKRYVPDAAGLYEGTVLSNQLYVYDLNLGTEGYYDPPIVFYDPSNIDLATDPYSYSYSVTASVALADPINDAEYLLVVDGGSISVPEPASLSLLAISVGGVFWARRRRMTRAAQSHLPRPLPSL